MRLSSEPKPQLWKRGAKAAFALVLALLVHGAFVGLIVFTSLFTLKGDEGRIKAPATAVVMRGLSPEAWQKNRVQNEKSARPEPSAAPRALREAKKEPKREDKKPQGQVVATAPGNGQEDPTAKYLAESSNKTAAETRAKDQTAFYRNAMQQRTSPKAIEAQGKDNVDVPKLAGNGGQGADPSPSESTAKQQAVFEVPDVKAHAEVALKQDPTTQGPGADAPNRDEALALEGNSKRLRIQPGAEAQGGAASSGKAGSPGLVDLMPSMAVLDKISGAAANDHLRDVNEGEATYLNTREWKYASFFNRVKQSIGLHWNPSAQLRLRDPTGEIYGARDRYTVVTVTLDEKGRLVDVFVDKASGVDFLDLEAIQSFERAAPFPNPPPGILAADARVRFQFGFYLEMSSSAPLRFFRSNN